MLFLLFIFLEGELYRGQLKKVTNYCLALEIKYSFPYDKTFNSSGVSMCLNLVLSGELAFQKQT